LNGRNLFCVIAAAVHLRVRAKAGEQHDHRLKKFLFHRFSFQAAAGSGCFSCGFFRNALIEPEQSPFRKARFPHSGWFTASKNTAERLTK
jgi:hypothetical protein